MKRPCNVLMVNYDYPPVGGIGTQRIFHFAKYLRDMGIRPVVLTSGHGLGKTQDHSATLDPAFKEIKVIRIGANELIPYHNNQLSGVARKIYNMKLALKYFWFGQIYYAWYREAKSAISQIIADEDIDCVWTTSPSYASLFFGLFARQKHDIPWIVDLRDSMVGRISTDKNLLNYALGYVDRYWERKLCAKADHVTCVSQPILDNLIQRTGLAQLSERSNVLPNGYDPEDYPVDKGSSPTVIARHSINIVYTGTLLGRRTPVSFLDAMEKLTLEHPEIARGLKFTFAGLIDKHIVDLIEAKLRHCRHEITGFQDRKKVIELQTQCDILLLLTIEHPDKNAREILTGKVFEYIGANRPIFATAPSGPLQELISQGGFGVTADPGDTADIHRKFLSLCTRMLSDSGYTHSPDSQYREQHSRKNQARVLAATITKLVSQNGSN